MQLADSVARPLMAGIKRISQYFAGFFLYDSMLGKVFIGSLGAPIGAESVPPRDSA